MPSRIVVNGRTLQQSRDFNAPQWSRGVPTDAYGRILDTNPVAPEPKPQPFPYEPGDHYEDPDDKLTYMVLVTAPAEHGWATAAFWCDRWKVGYPELVKLAKRRLLEPCIVYGSPVRRFRCPDERPVRALGRVLEAMQKDAKTRARAGR